MENPRENPAGHPPVIGHLGSHPARFGEAAAVPDPTAELDVVVTTAQHQTSVDTSGYHVHAAVALAKPSSSRKNLAGEPHYRHL